MKIKMVEQRRIGKEIRFYQIIREGEANEDNFKEKGRKSGIRLRNSLRPRGGFYGLLDIKELFKSI